MSFSGLSKKKLLEDRIKKSLKNGNITCPALRRIAEELEIPYRVAGKTANRLKIKIKNCDLGCF